MTKERVAIYKAHKDCLENQEYVAFIYFNDKRLPCAFYGRTEREAFDKAEHLRLKHLAEREEAALRKEDARISREKKKAEKENQ